MSDPRSTEQARIYEERAEEYDALISAEDCEGNLARALMARLPADGGVVVDVGAGTGRIARILGPHAKHVHLVDRAAPMLDVARRRLEASDAPISFDVHVADARTLPLPDHCADIVVAGWVFGHFRHWMPEGWREEVSAALAEMRRVARPTAPIVVLETLGTGHEIPRRHEALDEYFRWLEDEHGLARTWVRTDYQFVDAQRAAEICGSFFGEELGSRIRADALSRIPECTAIFVDDRSRSVS
jgi:ubiquinone/menaquinone biosynthesis C-methylase UbiE